MASRENSFALLDDEESDDMTKIIARVTTKNVASSQPSTADKINNKHGQREKRQNSSAQPQFPSKTLPTSDQYYVRAQGETGRVKGGRLDNQRADGYGQYSRRGVNGYNQDITRLNGDVPVKNLSADGKQHTDADGFQVYYRRKTCAGSEIISNEQAQDAPGGARGRRFNGVNGFRYYHHDHQVNQVANQEEVNDERRSIDRSAGAENWQMKEKISNVNGDDKASNGSSPIGERNDGDPGQGKHEPVASGDHSRNRAEDDKGKNKMTLGEYEKQLVEKRKALEALKTEERKVTLDKDFESMQLLDNKSKDGVLVKLNSGKDQLKKDSSNKDEKVRKPMSIAEFLKPPRGDLYRRRGGRYQRRGEGGGEHPRCGEDGGEHSRSVVAVDDGAPNFKDSEHFPALPASTKR